VLCKVCVLSQGAQIWGKRPGNERNPRVPDQERNNHEQDEAVSCGGDEPNCARKGVVEISAGKGS